MTSDSSRGIIYAMTDLNRFCAAVSEELDKSVERGLLAEVTREVLGNALQAGLHAVAAASPPPAPKGFPEVELLTSAKTRSSSDLGMTSLSEDSFTTQGATNTLCNLAGTYQSFVLRFTDAEAVFVVAYCQQYRDGYFWTIETAPEDWPERFRAWERSAQPPRCAGHADPIDVAFLKKIRDAAVEAVILDRREAEPHATSEPEWHRTEVARLLGVSEVSDEALYEFEEAYRLIWEAGDA